MSVQDNALLRPLTLGDLRLPNRVVMAPTTRCRATAELTPSRLHAMHYARRATAGLIVAEGTWVSERAIGVYRNVPGIFRPEQVEAWRTVTDLVHALGGRIFVQLWHTGGESPLQILDATDEFVTAARNAREAGFDGVEIAANGVYLFAQHLRWGRKRLLLDVVDATLQQSSRVAVRLSPYWRSAEFEHDERTLDYYDDVVDELDRRDLTYLHLRGPDVFDVDAFSRYRKLYGGALIVNNGFDPSTAAAAVEHGVGDAVSFARHFIANPDLVSRIALGQNLTDSDRATYYSGGPIGYV